MPLDMSREHTSRFVTAAALLFTIFLPEACTPPPQDLCELDTIPTLTEDDIEYLQVSVEDLLTHGGCFNGRYVYLANVQVTHLKHYEWGSPNFGPTRMFNAPTPEPTTQDVYGVGPEQGEPQITFTLSDEPRLHDGNYNLSGGYWNHGSKIDITGIQEQNVDE